jgi:hypothetical protein
LADAPRTASPRALERQIDDLYQRPLTEFTAARNALAKGLPAADAGRVKKLVKPAVIPWLINQVFWQARSVYDRLIEAGEAVRRTQIHAIEKPGTTPARTRQARDRLRDASERHRKAIADAVHQAVRIAGQYQLTPQTNVLTRMLEAISLAAAPPSEPGRWTELAQPAGFEALLGVAQPVAPPARVSARASAAIPGPSPTASVRSLADGRRLGDADRARAAAERERKRQALAAARDAEQIARRNAHGTSRALRDAEEALERARAAHAEANRALEKAVEELQRAIADVAD